MAWKIDIKIRIVVYRDHREGGKKVRLRRRTKGPSTVFIILSFTNI